MLERRTLSDNGVELAVLGAAMGRRWGAREEAPVERRAGEGEVDNRATCLAPAPLAREVEELNGLPFGKVSVGLPGPHVLIWKDASESQ